MTSHAAPPSRRLDLNPLPPTEEDQLADRRDDDQRPRPEVAQLPVDLREMVLEVLAIEADDERGEEQERGNHGQGLHDLVLVVRDLRLEVVADARDQITRQLEPVE